MSPRPMSDANREALAKMVGAPSGATEAELARGLREWTDEVLEQRAEARQVASLPVFKLPEATTPASALLPEGATYVPEGALVVDLLTVESLKARAEASDALAAELGKLVGVQTTDPAVIVAAVSEALAEAAGGPPNTERVDTEELAELRRDHELQRTHRERVAVEAAVMSGKIPVSQAATWAEWFTADPTGTQARLDRMAANTVPVEPIGHGDEPDEATRAEWLAGVTSRPMPTATTVPDASARRSPLAAT